MMDNTAVVKNLRATESQIIAIVCRIHKLLVTDIGDWCRVPRLLCVVDSLAFAEGGHGALVVGVGLDRQVSC